jgi:hypothetical protein
METPFKAKGLQQKENVEDDELCFCTLLLWTWAWFTQQPNAMEE